jgi:hypothetical protein
MSWLGLPTKYGDTSVAFVINAATAPVAGSSLARRVRRDRLADGVCGAAGTLTFQKLRRGQRRRPQSGFRKNYAHPSQPSSQVAGVKMELFVRTI